MVRYGLTPVQAIQTATQNPAKVFDLADTTGELKAGLQADILVVEGDVTADIEALRNVQRVYLSGAEM